MRGYLLPGVNGGHVKETKCSLVDGGGQPGVFVLLQMWALDIAICT